MPLDRYAEANLANWEDRVAIHVASSDYDLGGLARDDSRISGVVDFDRRRVGDVRGKRLVHLQCHIGTDTVSWARLGAEVTGVDFSPAAVGAARRLAADAGIDARFVESDVYEAAAAVGERFDIVYTGVGSLNWLADVGRWAEQVAGLLAPGGTFYLRDGHPMLYAIDDERADDLLVVRHDYFTPVAPQRWETPTTYTDGDDVLEHAVTYEWNHGLAEVVTALLDHGLTLTSLEEHRSIEWQAMPKMVPEADGRWVLPGDAPAVPLMYSLTARAPGGS